MFMWGLEYQKSFLSVPAPATQLLVGSACLYNRTETPLSSLLQSLSDRPLLLVTQREARYSARGLCCGLGVGRGLSSPTPASVSGRPCTPGPQGWGSCGVPAPPPQWKSMSVMYLLGILDARELFIPQLPLVVADLLGLRVS